MYGVFYMLDNKEHDLRVKKTRKLLCDSFIELMKVKSFKYIKVKEICEKAIVNRVTFYDHFKNKRELLNFLIDTMEGDFINNLSKYTSVDNFKNDYKIVIEKVFNYFDEKKYYFKDILINKDNSVIFENMIYKYFVFYITKALKNEKQTEEGNIVPLRLVAEFYAGAFSSVIPWWIKNGNNISKEEITKYVYDIVSRNIY